MRPVTSSAAEDRSSDRESGQAPVEKLKINPMRLSQVLTTLAAEPGERISLLAILAILRDRSFAVLVVLLGLPNCLPMPPPVPSVSACLLILISMQIAVRRPEPWFPHAVLQGSLAGADLRRAVGRALPVVSLLERWSRPRLRLFDPRIGAVLSALSLITMAIGMLTAAPVIGQVPFGLAVCLIGLGQLERDGLLVLSGLLAGLIGAVLSAGFIYGCFLAIRSFLY
jgi:hypothetical protein